MIKLKLKPEIQFRVNKIKNRANQILEDLDFEKTNDIILDVKLEKKVNKVCHALGQDKLPMKVKIYIYNKLIKERLFKSFWDYAKLIDKREYEARKAKRESKKKKNKKQKSFVKFKNKEGIQIYSRIDERTDKSLLKIRT